MWVSVNTDIPQGYTLDEVSEASVRKGVKQAVAENDESPHTSTTYNIIWLCMAIPL
jgi:hypothetical protein